MAVEALRRDVAAAARPGAGRALLALVGRRAADVAPGPRALARRVALAGGGVGAAAGIGAEAGALGRAAAVGGSVADAADVGVLPRAGLGLLARPQVVWVAAGLRRRGVVVARLNARAVSRNGTARPKE